MGALYDEIGRGYATRRRTEPRIAAPLHAALGDARTVVNVGAGAGGYEPADREVVAVEPSAAMIAQRPDGAGPAVRATAEALPFADGAFDAAMAVLTVHHWSDVARGLAEMRRVATGPLVALTCAPEAGFWLHDYLPGLRALDRATMPPMAAFAAAWGAVEVVPVPIPHDCVDGLLAAHWRRPDAYLDPAVRAATSPFALVDATAGLARLATDLDSGAWRRAHGALLTRDALDCGYRLVRTV